MPYADPEVKKQKQREWWARNRERQKLYKKMNAERDRAANREWRKKNLAKCAENSRLYRQRYPGASQIRSRIANTIRGHVKAASTVNLLGCEWDAFCWFLEAQFLPGMTWENYGSVWEIDHLTPLSWFDLSNPENQKQAFHFSNHRPLWVSENRRKGNRYVL